MLFSDNNLRVSFEAICSHSVILETYEVS